MMKELYSALLIPFDEKGQVIESGLREVIRHNIDENKVDGLYVNGSSGENFLLSTDQKKQIFKITAEETNKEAKLIAQVGALNLDEAIELGQYATELGYDSLSAVTPFYYKFNFEEIKAYYEARSEERRVGKSVDIGVRRIGKKKKSKVRMATRVSDE